MTRIRLTALLGALALAGAASAQDAPQTRIVTIVNADDVIGETVDGERLRRLIGNVHLLQDDTDLRASRAIQYIDRDQILFEGNVEIADATDTLRAATVRYDSRLRIGRARGDVRLADAEAVLYSDSLIFFRAEKRAVFEAPVRLVEREGDAVLTSRRGTYFTDRKEALFQQDVRLEDSTTVLTSRLGRYGTEDKRADFSGDVRLAHEQATHLRADSLTHYRETQVSEARGDVVILRFGGRDADPLAPPDTTRRTLLFGGFAFHDEEARYSRVERGYQPFDPLVARLTTDSLGITDTLLVRAHRFEVLQPDTLDAGAIPAGATLQRVIARSDVHLAGDRLAASADSVVVDRLEFDPDDFPERPTDEDMRLFMDPIAWMNSRGSTQYTQITADTLRLTARDEAVDTLRATGRAFAVRPDSAIDRNNQIRGRQMLALFREDSLRAIRVWPNAEALFFRADSLDQIEGASRVTADSLSFTFRGDELERISGVRGVEGTYYDAAIIPTPFRLEGPPYRPDDRPTRATLLAGRPPLVDPFGTPPPPPVDAPPAGDVPLPVEEPPEPVEPPPAGDVPLPVEDPPEPVDPPPAGDVPLPVEDPPEPVEPPPAGEPAPYDAGTAPQPNRSP